MTDDVWHTPYPTIGADEAGNEFAMIAGGSENVDEVLFSCACCDRYAAATAGAVDTEEICLERRSAAGVGIVTTELVVFEWLEKSRYAVIREDAT